MRLPRNAHVEGDLVIVGDEAWTQEDVERWRRARDRENAHDRALRADPEYRERYNAYYRRYLPAYRARKAA